MGIPSRSPGQRIGAVWLSNARSHRKFERTETGLGTGHLGDQLVARHRVVIATALHDDFGPRQPGVGTDMCRTDAPRMMQPADRSDVLPVFLQRLERLAKLIVATRGGDLPRQHVHSVRNIHEHTPPGLAANGHGSSPQRLHAIQ